MGKMGPNHVKEQQACLHQEQQENEEAICEVRIQIDASTDYLSKLDSLCSEKQINGDNGTKNLKDTNETLPLRKERRFNGDKDENSNINSNKVSETLPLEMHNSNGNGITNRRKASTLSPPVTQKKTKSGWSVGLDITRSLGRSYKSGKALLDRPSLNDKSVVNEFFGKSLNDKMTTNGKPQNNKLVENDQSLNNKLVENDKSLHAKSKEDNKLVNEKSDGLLDKSLKSSCQENGMVLQLFSTSRKKRESEIKDQSIKVSDDTIDFNSSEKVKESKVVSLQGDDKIDFNSLEEIKETKVVSLQTVDDSDSSFPTVRWESINSHLPDGNRPIPLEGLVVENTIVESQHSAAPTRIDLFTLNNFEPDRKEESNNDFETDSDSDSETELGDFTHMVTFCESQSRETDIANNSSHLESGEQSILDHYDINIDKDLEFDEIDAMFEKYLTDQLKTDSVPDTLKQCLIENNENEDGEEIEDLIDSYLEEQYDSLPRALQDYLSPASEVAATKDSDWFQLYLTPAETSDDESAVVTGEENNQESEEDLTVSIRRRKIWHQKEVFKRRFSRLKRVLSIVQEEPPITVDSVFEEVSTVVRELVDRVCLETSHAVELNVEETIEDDHIIEDHFENNAKSDNFENYIDSHETKLHNNLVYSNSIKSGLLLQKHDSMDYRVTPFSANLTFEKIFILETASAVVESDRKVVSNILSRIVDAVCQCDEDESVLSFYQRNDRKRESFVRGYQDPFAAFDELSRRDDEVTSLSSSDECDEIDDSGITTSSQNNKFETPTGDRELFTETSIEKRGKKSNFSNLNEGNNSVGDRGANPPFFKSRRRSSRKLSKLVHMDEYVTKKRGNESFKVNRAKRRLAKTQSVSDDLFTTNFDVKATIDESGDTCLHVAASNGDISTIKFLIKRGPNLLYCENNDHQLPINRAVDFQTARLLSNNMLFYGTENQAENGRNSDIVTIL